MPGGERPELLTIAPLLPVPAPEIEALLDLAFGPARRARTAYRLREGATAIPALSLAARDGDRLVGTLQSWPVALVEPNGARADLVMVGPVAVLPELQGAGIGTALMQALIDAADALGETALMMIGDPDYYARFGFDARATGGWRIDAGPYDQQRLLARVRGPVPAVGRLAPAASADTGAIAA